MELAKIMVSGTDTRVVSLKAIPAGITGATVRFVYEDPAWAGLRKHAVFVGTKSVVVMDVETVAEIPQEVVGKMRLRCTGTGRFRDRPRQMRHRREEAGLRDLPWGAAAEHCVRRHDHPGS